MENRKKIAAIITTYFPHSHADVIATGRPWDGTISPGPIRVNHLKGDSRDYHNCNRIRPISQVKTQTPDRKCGL